MKSSFTEDFDDYDSRSRGFANGRHGQTDSMYNMSTNKSTIEDHKGDLDDLDDQFYMNMKKRSGKSKEKIDRMTNYDNKKNWMIYPESPYKGHWDLFITLILLISCFSTPYIIAFGDVGSNDGRVKIFENVIDVLFLSDVIVIFNTAFYTENFDMIDNRKEIAYNYLKGWFTIDILAILPFDYILALGNYDVKMVRIVRVGRLYKLVKLTRLLRILKLVKDKNKLMKYLNDLLKVGLGFERLFFFILISIIIMHIVTCLWIIVAAIQDEKFKDTWIESIDAH